MSLINILVFSAAAFIVSVSSMGKLRNHLLLVASLLAIYWLQPLMPVRNLDFWLPTFTVILTVLGWVIITPNEQRNSNENWITGVIITLVMLGIGATRFVSLDGIITASRPPQIDQIFLVLAVSFCLVLLVCKCSAKTRQIGTLFFILLILILIVLKTPVLSTFVASHIRGIMAQDSLIDPSITYIKWLGFSYVAFRIMHTLRDGVLGRLPLTSLNEYIIFVLFFPSLSAGPIDRVERFIKDLRIPFNLSEPDLMYAIERMVNGLLKKFIIADSLALVALNPQNAVEVRSTGWMWVIVYLYAFQIYFDFSGYTDIAISIGRLMGIQLPENFNNPYLKPNLAQFWNNWHMTLTQWLRGYFYFPITRAMMRSHHRLPNYLINFIAQMGTMLLIALWHGVTINFSIWGIWHGLGLFINNRWAEKVNLKLLIKNYHPFTRSAINLLSVFITFNFVALGWVWFALPLPEISLRVFAILFGIHNF